MRHSQHKVLIITKLPGFFFNCYFSSNLDFVALA